jgi:hypothetical protein
MRKDGYGALVGDRIAKKMGESLSRLGVSDGIHQNVAARGGRFVIPERHQMVITIQNVRSRDLKMQMLVLDQREP